MFLGARRRTLPTLDFFFVVLIFACKPHLVWLLLPLGLYVGLTLQTLILLYYRLELHFEGHSGSVYARRCSKAKERQGETAKMLQRKFMHQVWLYLFLAEGRILKLVAYLEHYAVVWCSEVTEVDALRFPAVRNCALSNLACVDEIFGYVVRLTRRPQICQDEADP